MKSDTIFIIIAAKSPRYFSRCIHSKHGPMPDHRLRCWANLKTTLSQSFAFLGPGDASHDGCDTKPGRGTEFESQPGGSRGCAYAVLQTVQGYVFGVVHFKEPLKSFGKSIGSLSRYCHNVVLLLVQHRRRWANSRATLGQCIVLAGKTVFAHSCHIRWKQRGAARHQKQLVTALPFLSLTTAPPLFLWRHLVLPKKCQKPRNGHLTTAPPPWMTIRHVFVHLASTHAILVLCHPD